MSQLVFISKKNEANVLNAMGFFVHVIEKDEEVTEILRDIDRSVVILGYDSELRDLFKQYKEQKKSFFPLLLELPLDTKNLGEKQLEIKENIKKSIGIDLL